jgi:prephenate dehydratase
MRQADAAQGPDGPVAYSGEPGAFAEDAVVAAFGDVERAGLAGFRAVFEALARGEARAGVLPIENLVQGTVREVYDLLLEFELEIVGEVVVPVELALAALPGQRLEDVARVYSHIQALGQAERFLRSRSWTLLTTYNTAGSGRMIVDRQERASAAVLSRRAAAALGLEILADTIQDVADNRTRFVVVAQPSDQSATELLGGGPSQPRTTIAFSVRNEPGTLLAALRSFAERGINLSKLESRPSRTAAWEYVFWADLDADRSEPACAAALAELQAASTMLRVLGSYARAREPMRGPA